MNFLPRQRRLQPAHTKSLQWIVLNYWSIDWSVNLAGIMNSSNAALKLSCDDFHSFWQGISELRRVAKRPFRRQGHNPVVNILIRKLEYHAYGLHMIGWQGKRIQGMEKKIAWGTLLQTHHLPNDATAWWDELYPTFNRTIMSITLDPLVLMLSFTHLRYSKKSIANSGNLQSAVVQPTCADHDNGSRCKHKQLWLLM